MKIFKLILAIGFCSCTVAAPGVLTRRKRVSGYDDSGTNNDELMGDYDTDYSYDEDLYEEEEFTCTNENGEKVALYLMCDGFHDCLDGSDEVALNCEENGITPLSDTFVSATQSVTTPSPEPVKPDIVDIGDYDDYADACTEDEFQCSSDISICLPKLQVCDGVSDCPENEDEAECHGAGKWILPIFGVANPRYDESEVLKKVKGSDYVDYSPNGENENHLPDLSVPTEETASKSKVVFKPKVLFKEAPRPREEKKPVFLPRPEQETNRNLGLEADYQYINLDKDGNVPDGQLGAKLYFQNTKPDHTNTDLPLLLPHHEIEINHETGEVTVIENGVRRLLPPKLSSQEGSFQPQTMKEPKALISSPEQREGVRGFSTPGDNKFVERRKEIRVIVGQLLRRVGSLVEEEGQSEDFGDVNVQVGLEDNFSESSLYSRTLRRPRTRVTLNVNIQL